MSRLRKFVYFSLLILLSPMLAHGADTAIGRVVPTSDNANTAKRSVGARGDIATNRATSPRTRANTTQHNTTQRVHRVRH